MSLLKTLAMQLIVSVFTGLMAYWSSYIKAFRNRQFKTINPKERYDAFSLLKELDSRENIEDEWSRYERKALYERIGMFFPEVINKKILSYAYQMHMRYDNEELSSFLKSAPFVKASDISVHWAKDAYRKHLREMVLAGILMILVAVFLSVAFLDIALDFKVGDFYFVLFYSLSVYMLMCCAFVFYIVMADRSRKKKAWGFYEKFSVWLEEQADIEVGDNQAVQSEKY